MGRSVLVVKGDKKTILPSRKNFLDILKNFSGKGFEFSVFCDPVSGKITGSKAGEKCQDKKQSDENRKFIFPDFKRHKTVFHYCLQTYTMWRVLMVSKQTVTSFQSGALFYHIGKLRNL